MKTLLSIALMAIISSCVWAAPQRSALGGKSTIDSLLAVYDRELMHAEAYLQAREMQIQQAVDPYEKALFYIGYQSDSALFYLDQLTTVEALLKKAYLLASIGSYHAAHVTIARLNVNTMTLVQRRDYYETINHIYGEEAHYSQLPSERQECWHQESISRDSLRHYIRLTGKSVDYRLSTHKKEALGFQPAKPLEDTHDYAKYAYEQSVPYHGVDGQEDAELEWLLRSAIADVRTGVTDNGSSWMVAQILFKRGDVERAYRYITYSLDNADRYNATLRKGQVAPLMNIISSAYDARQQSQQTRLRIVLGVLVVLVLMLVATLILLVSFARKRQQLNAELSALNAQLKYLNQQLTEANHIKEEYIGHYLTIYSQCIYRMRKLVKDPAFMDQEMAEFYRNFDQAFLSIYPDFVERFNALLVLDSQIQPKKGDLLNTELRIYALVRLGIQSSAKIAELLCYAPNTIYNYRARMKQQARLQDVDFDSQVMQIGTFVL